MEDVETEPEGLAEGLGGEPKMCHQVKRKVCFKK